MILRQIIATEDISCCRVTLKLECGHEVGPIPAREQPKFRKRCKECELIATFRTQSPGDYDFLLNRLRKVPMDDRAAILVQWIVQVRDANALFGKGLSSMQAMSLAEKPSRYSLTAHLCCDDDEGPNDEWTFNGE